jgi:hypothetical protein
VFDELAPDPTEPVAPVAPVYVTVPLLAHFAGYELPCGPECSATPHVSDYDPSVDG